MALPDDDEIKNNKSIDELFDWVLDIMERTSRYWPKKWKQAFAMRIIKWMLKDWIGEWEL